MAVSLTLPRLSITPRSDDGDIAIGPLSLWLRWDMLGIVWAGRFDFILQRTDYRPEAGQWFETWRDSEEERGGYFLGRKWNLQTGSLVQA